MCSILSDYRLLETASVHTVLRSKQFLIRLFCVLFDHVILILKARAQNVSDNTYLDLKSSLIRIFCAKICLLTGLLIAPNAVLSDYPNFCSSHPAPKLETPSVYQYWAIANASPHVIYFARFLVSKLRL